MTAAALPSRLLMTCDAMGGVWDYALELADGLGRRGVAVDLAVLGDPPGPEREAAAAALPGVSLHVLPCRLEWMDGCEADLERSAAWLLELEARLRPDLVHVNGYAQAALPFRAPVMAVAHSCVLSWWQAVRGGPAPAEWQAYARRVSEGLAAAALVAAPTRAMLAAAERHYGPLPHGRVLANGRSPARFRPGSNEPFILSAGRIWDEAKNIGALDAIADRLDWPVRVAGSLRGPDGGPRRLSHAEWLGVLPSAALAGEMARASVFALPARYEPFGLSVLEAALSGCALVLGDIPSLRETWDDAAVFVPPDDGTALAGALQDLAREPRRLAALAAAALDRAQHFGSDAMVAGYLGAYRDLMRSPIHSVPC
ncbi:glycosyltransferase family 4 protein [Arenibaculum pallidiluteum]|uniref:glycosyltransferase family 4 protein n=1 Tax=Arenibaculum pallidiluteum TaxID=2812559 RepID=UPI001A96C2BE|nr:glycosyltransferase family 4 protein [Arenibaculum pallidiluteum]